MNPYRLIGNSLKGKSIHLEQHRYQRNCEDGAYGSDEGYLGDERRVATILNAKHCTKRGDRHGYHYGVYVVDNVANSTNFEQIIYR